MSANIVILSGSPRKNGSTERLVREFIKGASDAGKRVAEYRVADMKIAPCLGCGSCHQSGVCVHKDDMPQILDALRSADALLFASPVYYWNITAQLKTAIDRFYSSLRINPLTVKRAALLLTCGNAAPDACEGSVVTYKRICRHQNWEDAGIITAQSLHSPEMLDGRAELEQARELGKNL
ncbi:MAG: flavodoxin family protein [Oscillospiraceae bacterium]|jgi:multimeric flavodoxin WrbA|nr:flavodoxin family protein [Oscillospiraceae bacterium]